MNKKTAMKKPVWWQRIIQRIAGTEPVTRFFIPRMKKIDEYVLALSGGRTTLTEILVGFPTIWVTMTGAKTGKKRTVPLIGIRDGERFAVIASNFGQPGHPDWYYNLKANPDVHLRANGEERTYTAILVDDTERITYWQMAVEIFPGYEVYNERSGSRVIPIFLLSPARSQSDKDE